MDSNITLWQFLLDLLVSNQHPDIITWTSNEGEFKVRNTEIFECLHSFKLVIFSSNKEKTGPEKSIWNIPNNSDKECSVYRGTAIHKLDQYQQDSTGTVYSMVLYGDGCIDGRRWVQISGLLWEERKNYVCYHVSTFFIWADLGFVKNTFLLSRFGLFLSVV